MQSPENQYPQYPYQQPGSFSQPPQQPGRARRFIRWYRQQGGCMKVVVALGIIFVVLFVCSAAVSGVVQGISESSPPPTPAAASQASNATQAPTPTDTPTPKPTPTPTVQQRISQIVHDNATQANKITMAQNDGKTVVAQITLNEMLDQSAARLFIRENCYNIEKALWTAHIASLQDVNLAFSGPATDKYGNNTTSPYGVCDLTKDTAAKFNWGNLTQDSAWDAYDNAVYYPIIQG